MEATFSVRLCDERTLRGLDKKGSVGKRVRGAKSSCIGREGVKALTLVRYCFRGGQQRDDVDELIDWEGKGMETGCVLSVQEVHK